LKIGRAGKGGGGPPLYLPSLLCGKGGARALLLFSLFFVFSGEGEGKRDLDLREGRLPNPTASITISIGAAEGTPPRYSLPKKKRGRSQNLWEARRPAGKKKKEDAHTAGYHEPLATSQRARVCPSTPSPKKKGKKSTGSVRGIRKKRGKLVG